MLSALQIDKEQLPAKKSFAAARAMVSFAWSWRGPATLIGSTR